MIKKMKMQFTTGFFMRTFIHMDFLNEQDSGTIILLHFRYLMDADQHGRTVTDATLIAAP